MASRAGHRRRPDHRGRHQDTRSAWIVLLLIPIIVMMFKATHRHYQHVASS
jgi:hypothetical protein